jgi:outer membrane protein TolC
MAAANEQIGIAQAAFFPDLTLSGSFGYSSSAADRLFKAASNAWAFGPQLAETLFDAGARSARLAQARAFHEQTIADYRSTVLVAFQQVEDQLASLRHLEEQAAIQARALAAAREAERLETNQYRAGTVDYSTVVTAQQNALDNEQAMLTIQEARLVASVALVQAVGGSWQQTPAAAQTTPQPQSTARPAATRGASG